MTLGMLTVKITMFHNTLRSITIQQNNSQHRLNFQDCHLCSVLGFHYCVEYCSPSGVCSTWQQTFKSKHVYMFWCL